MTDTNPLPHITRENIELVPSDLIPDYYTIEESL